MTLPTLEALGAPPRWGPPPLFLCVQSCLLGPVFFILVDFSSFLKGVAGTFSDTCVSGSLR